MSIDATNGVSVDNAKVVKADIEASNGVIHVIDTVIMPKEYQGLSSLVPAFGRLLDRREYVGQAFGHLKLVS